MNEVINNLTDAAIIQFSKPLTPKSDILDFLEIQSRIRKVVSDAFNAGYKQRVIELKSELKYVSRS
jgi:hypothetical protein